MKPPTIWRKISKINQKVLVKKNVVILSIFIIICRIRDLISRKAFNRWESPAWRTLETLWSLSTLISRALTNFPRRTPSHHRFLCRLRMSVGKLCSLILPRAARRARKTFLSHRPQFKIKENSYRSMLPHFRHMVDSGANLKKRLKRCKMRKSNRILKILDSHQVSSAKNFQSRQQTETTCSKK